MNYPIPASIAVHRKGFACAIAARAALAKICAPNGQWAGIRIVEMRATSLFLPDVRNYPVGKAREEKRHGMQGHVA